MYTIETTPHDGGTTKLMGKYATETDAIAKARELAATVDQDVTWITVNDDQGNSVWDNEGDWQNA
jgi:hypothetical protein